MRTSKEEGRKIKVFFSFIFVFAFVFAFLRTRLLATAERERNLYDYNYNYTVYVAYIRTVFFSLLPPTIFTLTFTLTLTAPCPTGRAGIDIWGCRHLRCVRCLDGVNFNRISINPC